MGENRGVVEDESMIGVLVAVVLVEPAPLPGVLYADSSDTGTNGD